MPKITADIPASLNSVLDEEIARTKTDASSIVTTALAQYLPGGGGQVLITSRNSGWHELATPVRVDVFDRGESITLLRRRTHQLTESEARQMVHHKYRRLDWCSSVSV